MQLKIQCIFTFLSIHSICVSAAPPINQDLRGVLVIGDNLARFTQDSFIPFFNSLSETILSGAKPDPFQITSSFLVMLEQIGIGIARTSNDYQQQVLPAGSDFSDAILATKVGCGVKFTAHGVNVVTTAVEKYLTSDSDVNPNIVLYRWIVPLIVEIIIILFN